MSRCGTCSLNVDDPKLVACPQCGGPLAFVATAPDLPPPAPEANQPATPLPVPPPTGAPPLFGKKKGGLAWEEEGMNWDSFVATCKAVVLSPVETMRGAASGRPESPLTFFLATQIPAVIGSVFFLWLLTLNKRPFTHFSLKAVQKLLTLERHPSLLMAFGLMIFGVLISVAGLYLIAAVTQFYLNLLGRGRGGFPATLRAYCYGNVAALLQILPWCGTWLSLIAELILLCLILAPAHREENDKGFIAVPLAYATVFLALCIGGIALGGIMAAAQDPYRFR